MTLHDSVLIERVAQLLTSYTGHSVQMISSHGALLNHELADDFGYPPTSLWHTTTSRFHKNISAQTLTAGNDA